MKQFWTLSPLAVVAATTMAVGLPLGLTGCGGHGDHAGHGDASGGHDHHHDMAGLEATAGPGYTVDDVMFMQMMLGHHAQAVTMANLVPERSTDPGLARLSEKIRISQDDEMALMIRWLRERAQDVPTEAQMRAMRMPGMISDAQMERLATLEGSAFDALFLELMIEHHLGALGMVEDIFARPGSMQDSELFQFVSDVGTDQLDEIGVMEALLERLTTSARSTSR
jgi:uncharacterized protein (DUF305 family)